MATGPGWTRSNHAPDVTPLAIAPHPPAPSVAAVLGRRNLEADRPMRRRLGDVWLVWGVRPVPTRRKSGFHGINFLAT